MEVHLTMMTLECLLVAFSHLKEMVFQADRWLDLSLGREMEKEVDQIVTSLDTRTLELMKLAAPINRKEF